MKAIVIDRFGGTEQLHLQDIPIPPPEEEEIQIQVEYSGVNPVDWKIREGLFQQRLPHEFPIILGWEASGRINALGKNVKNFRVGDEVFVFCKRPTVHWGTYAEYVNSEAFKVAKKPENINFAQAAAIPLAGLTAWQALFDAAKLQRGETILIHAGGGGVGSLAIQFAKNAGAKVITTASAQNHDYVKKLGADIAFDYHEVNIKSILEKHVPQGFDVILDSIGGDTLKLSLDLVKKGGRVISLLEQVTPEAAQMRNIHFQYMSAQPSGEQLNEIGELILKGKVKPPRIEEYPLSHAAKAQEKNQEGHTIGKIVLKARFK